METLTKEKKTTLNGKDINGVGIFYENISISDTDGNSYFLSIDELAKILKGVKFDVETKRVRSWLSKSKKK